MKTTNLLDKIGNENPFKTPEGYLDGLSREIMSQLPEKNRKETRTVTLWERVQPWLYMAAMFCGIALMVNLFTGSPQKTSQGLNLTSSADIEDFYQYYEEQLTNNMYRDAVYLDVE